MTWRPENWKNPYKNPVSSQAFEKGADAMFEALQNDTTQWRLMDVIYYHDVKEYYKE